MPQFITGKMLPSLEEIHDASMSKDDAALACAARLANMCANAMDVWLHNEKARGTNPLHILRGANSAAVSVLMTAVCNVASPAKRPALAEAIRPVHMEFYDDCVRELRRQAEEA